MSETKDYTAYEEQIDEGGNTVTKVAKPASRTTDTVIIAGEDFSEWDFEARQIMDHLAEHPTMPLREDRNMPAARVLINMVLRAQSVLRAKAAA